VCRPAEAGAASVARKIELHPSFWTSVQKLGVLTITGGGADAAFDFVGIPAVTQSGLDMISPGGGLYLIGIVDPSATLPVLTIGLIGTQKRIQKRIQGVYMGSTTPKRDIPLYADLYLQGRFNLDDLVSREIALDGVDGGYDELKDPEVTRVVITTGLS
jgi:S-(hydroxymethyl)glutathione dehydrogenase/alcohol dehydrogenase